MATLHWCEAPAELPCALLPCSLITIIKICMVEGLTGGEGGLEYNNTVSVIRYDAVSTDY